VATLGSKSSLKTVTRKKILDVDVHKACNTILNPEAPMALRLQGNLLYVAVFKSLFTESTHLSQGTAWHASTLSNAAMYLATRKLFATRSEACQ
jgi:N terminus of Rad21 / Rec8 like protein